MAYNAGTDPTLAELITGKFVGEAFSAVALGSAKGALVCVPPFNHYYRPDLKKGYKVNIPVFSQGTAGEVTPGTETTVQDLASTAKSITIDQWYVGGPIEVSEMEDIEGNADYLIGAAEECGYQLQKKMDATVGALFSALASSSVYGADGQTFTDEIFDALVETLDEADVPNENRVLIGDPSTRKDMKDVEKFISTDYVRSPVIPTGQFGELDGVRCLWTNNLTAATTGSYGVLAHRDAIGIVIQANPYSQRIPMPWKHIIKYQVKGIWGVGELRDTFGKSFYTRSA